MNAKSNVLRLADELPAADVDEGQLGQLDQTIAARGADLEKIRARLAALDAEELNAGRRGDMAQLDSLSKSRLIAEGAVRVLSGVLEALQRERDGLAARIETRRREAERAASLVELLRERPAVELAYQEALEAARDSFEAPYRAVERLQKTAAALKNVNGSISLLGGPPPGIAVLDEESFIREVRGEVVNRYFGGRPCRRFEVPIPPAVWLT